MEPARFCPRCSRDLSSLRARRTLPQMSGAAPGPGILFNLRTDPGSLPSVSCARSMICHSRSNPTPPPDHEGGHLGS